MRLFKHTSQMTMLALLLAAPAFANANAPNIEPSPAIAQEKLIDASFDTAPGYTILAPVPIDTSQRERFAAMVVITGKIDAISDIPLETGIFGNAALVTSPATVTDRKEAGKESGLAVAALLAATAMTADAV